MSWKPTANDWNLFMLAWLLDDFHLNKFISIHRLHFPFDGEIGDVIFRDEKVHQRIKIMKKGKRRKEKKRGRRYMKGLWIDICILFKKAGRDVVHFSWIATFFTITMMFHKCNFWTCCLQMFGFWIQWFFVYSAIELRYVYNMQPAALLREKRASITITSVLFIL